jgi:hypothetical protein
MVIDWAIPCDQKNNYQHMKVLILHQHFNTPEKGGAQRSYYLAKALVDHGIETIVITGSNEKKYRQDHYEGIELFANRL